MQSDLYAWSSLIKSDHLRGGGGGACLAGGTTGVLIGDWSSGCYCTGGSDSYWAASWSLGRRGGIILAFCGKDLKLSFVSSSETVCSVVSEDFFSKTKTRGGR
jgi:hypothetical protein